MSDVVLVLIGISLGIGSGSIIPGSGSVIGNEGPDGTGSGSSSGVELGLIGHSRLGSWGDLD